MFATIGESRFRLLPPCGALMRPLPVCYLGVGQRERTAVFLSPTTPLYEILEQTIRKQEDLIVTSKATTTFLIILQD